MIAGVVIVGVVIVGALRDRHEHVCGRSVAEQAAGQVVEVPHHLVGQLLVLGEDERLAKVGRERRHGPRGCLRGAGTRGIRVARVARGPVAQMDRAAVS